MSQIRKIEKWITEDYKEHSSEEFAKDWDLEIQKAKQATKLFETGMALAIVYQKVYGRECPENLKMITKDTLITISYLQCCDYPRYKVSHFKPGGFVYVHGSKKGWLNAYGSVMDLNEVSQHYERTIA